MKCHFLVQVKSNCRRLWPLLRLHTALARPFSSFESCDNTHGRQVNRKVELYKADQIELPEGWPVAQRLVKVRRWGTRKGKPFDETAVYMLSKALNSACTIGQILQQHWSIENNLHWIKDVNFGEDKMSWITPRHAATIAMLNNVAVNLLRGANMKPTRDNLAMLCNNVPRLAKVLNKT